MTLNWRNKECNTRHFTPPVEVDSMWDWISAEGNQQRLFAVLQKQFMYLCCTTLSVVSTKMLVFFPKYISLVIFKIFFLHPSRRVGSGFLENIVKLTEQNKPSINLADASKTCIQAG